MAETEKKDISYMGPIFKKYRIDAKRTQEDVAEKVGITSRFLMAVAFRAKCKMFSRHLQKPILKTEKGRFKGL